MAMHCHPKHRLVRPRPDSPMESVLCAAASFWWSNCVASCRFLSGFVCLGDMASLEDERLKERAYANAAYQQMGNKEGVLF